MRLKCFLAAAHAAASPPSGFIGKKYFCTPVSWTVWSHHLLADQAQPAILKVVSGEMVTAFELITQGLALGQHGADRLTHGSPRDALHIA